MWLRFSVKLIMSVVMLFLIYKQLHQDHLDIWFIVYILLYMFIVSSWDTYANKK